MVLPQHILTEHARMWAQLPIPICPHRPEVWRPHQAGTHLFSDPSSVHLLLAQHHLAFVRQRTSQSTGLPPYRYSELMDSLYLSKRLLAPTIRCWETPHTDQWYSLKEFSAQTSSFGSNVSPRGERVRVWGFDPLYYKYHL